MLRGRVSGGVRATLSALAITLLIAGLSSTADAQAHNYRQAPLLLGFVLGPMLESTFGAR